MQSSEVTAIHFLTRDEDALRNEVGIKRVPIDVALVPVRIVALAKKVGQCLHLLGVGDDKDAIVLLQRSVGGRKQDLPGTPDATCHKVPATEFGGLFERLAEDGWICHLKGSDESLVVFACLIHTLVAKPYLDGYECKDDTYHSDGIGDGQ